MTDWHNITRPQPLQYTKQALFAGYVVSMATVH